MSGRKACEVASVLNESEAIQKDIFNSYKNNISDDIKSIKNMNNSINSKKQTIDAYELEDFDDVEKELPIEADNVKNKLDKLKNSLLTVDIENVASFENKEIKIEEEIDNSNRKASEIRVKIKNSPHYVDKEYNEAQELKNSLNLSKKKYQNLTHEVNRAESKTSKVELEITSKMEDLNDITNEVSKLDNEALVIKKIRNEAGALKKSIEESIKSIDSFKAEKFEKSNFDNIKKNEKKFNSLTNEGIIKAYPVFSATISTLKSSYTQKYNNWLAEKNYSEKFLNDVLTKGLKEELVLLDDIVQGGSTKVSKLAYYDEYKKSNKLDEFNILMKEAKGFFEKENFNESNNLVKQANELYSQISDEADTIREHIEASANIAFKIRKIMLSDEINFRKAHLELIDGNPINGFTLACQNGDTINFEEIKFDEKGDLIINLDHIENTGGTCGVRWSKMQKVFNENGIPLTDVKKNGNSVIYRDVRRKESKEEILKRER